MENRELNAIEQATVGISRLTEQEREMVLAFIAGLTSRRAGEGATA